MRASLPDESRPGSRAEWSGIREPAQVRVEALGPCWVPGQSRRMIRHPYLGAAAQVGIGGREKQAQLLNRPRVAGQCFAGVFPKASTLPGVLRLPSGRSTSRISRINRSWQARIASRGGGDSFPGGWQRTAFVM